MTNNKDVIATKRAELDKLLEQQYVYLHINTKVAGLEVPQNLLDKPTITLQFSRFFRGAMELKEDMIEADLLFNQDYFHCLVPLSAVWGATDSFKRTQMWPDAMTPEILGQVTVKEKAEKPPLKKPSKPKAGHLRRVK